MQSPASTTMRNSGTAPLGERAGVRESAWYRPTEGGLMRLSAAKTQGQAEQLSGQVSEIAVPCLRPQRPRVKIAAG